MPEMKKPRKMSAMPPQSPRVMKVVALPMLLAVEMRREAAIYRYADAGVQKFARRCR